MVRTWHKAGDSGRFRHGYLLASISGGKKTVSTPIGKQFLARTAVSRG